MIASYDDLRPHDRTTAATSASTANPRQAEATTPERVTLTATIIAAAPARRRSVSALTADCGGAADAPAHPSSLASIVFTSTKETLMTTHLAAAGGNQTPTRTGRAPPRTAPARGRRPARTPGIQLDGGIIAAAYRGTSTVSDERLNFPFSGSLATATSLTWGLSQALFVLTLLAFVRSGAVGTSRAGRIGACSRSWAASCSSPRMRSVSPSATPASTTRQGLAAIALFLLGTLCSAVWVHRCRRGRRPRRTLDVLAALLGPPGRASGCCAWCRCS